jgi:hypothetical protein
LCSRTCLKSQGAARAAGASSKNNRLTRRSSCPLIASVSPERFRYNPINGIRRPKDDTREWRLDDAGYRKLGKCVATAEANGEHWQRILASKAATLTGCRLDEIEGLLKTEVDGVGMALRLGDRPI